MKKRGKEIDCDAKSVKLAGGATRAREWRSVGSRSRRDLKGVVLQLLPRLNVCSRARCGYNWPANTAAFCRPELGHESPGGRVARDRQTAGRSQALETRLTPAFHLGAAIKTSSNLIGLEDELQDEFAKTRPAALSKKGRKCGHSR
jgi:hypothetical protein